MNILSSETKRNIISYFITFAIYMPFFAWWTSSQPILRASPSQVENQDISLDLTQFQEEAPKPNCDPVQEIEEVPTPEEQPEKTEVQEQPEVQEAPKVAEPPEPPKEIAIIKSKPKVLKKPEAKKPKPKVVKKPKKKVKKSPKKAKMSSAKKSQSKKTSSSKRSQRPHTNNTAGKSKFTAKLRARINANKKYPRIAEKRGMQGKVSIRFTINSAGKLTNLQVSGSRVFINSAKQAVKKSFPISTGRVSLPMSIKLILNYRLK